MIDSINPQNSFVTKENTLKNFRPETSEEVNTRVWNEKKGEAGYEAMGCLWIIGGLLLILIIGLAPWLLIPIGAGVAWFITNKIIKRTKKSKAEHFK